MSDLTPPKYWKTEGPADYWLDRFVKEVEGPVENAQFFRLSALVFDKVREGWETRIVLKKQFADNPDGLINFIEKYRAGKTDEEWEAGRPVMVTNDGPEPKDVGEHA